MFVKVVGNCKGTRSMAHIICKGVWSWGLGPMVGRCDQNVKVLTVRLPQCTISEETLSEESGSHYYGNSK